MVIINNHISEYHANTDETSNQLRLCDVLNLFSDYYQRLTLESWFTNLQQTPLNRSQQLPAPHKLLIDGLKQNF